MKKRLGKRLEVLDVSRTAEEEDVFFRDFGFEAKFLDEGTVETVFDVFDFDELHSESPHDLADRRGARVDLLLGGVY